MIATGRVRSALATPDPEIAVATSGAVTTGAAMRIGRRQ
jgi:hypothetical protein